MYSHAGDIYDFYSDLTQSCIHGTIKNLISVR